MALIVWALPKRMKLKFTHYFNCLSLAILSLFVAFQVKAAEDYGLSAATPTSIPRNVDVPSSIGRIIAIALGFTGTIFFILVVYAGLTWMTAAGNEENIKKAQSILKTAIVGLVLVLCAYAITTFLGGQLTK